MTAHNILVTLVRGPKMAPIFRTEDRGLMRVIYSGVRRWLDPKIVAEWEEVFAEMEESDEVAVEAPPKTPPEDIPCDHPSRCTVHGDLHGPPGPSPLRGLWSNYGLTLRLVSGFWRHAAARWFLPSLQHQLQCWEHNPTTWMDYSVKGDNPLFDIALREGWVATVPDPVFTLRPVRFRFTEDGIRFLLLHFGTINPASNVANGT